MNGRQQWNNLKDRAKSVFMLMEIILNKKVFSIVCIIEVLLSSSLLWDTLCMFIFC